MGFINFDITVGIGDDGSYKIKSEYEKGGESAETQPGPPDLSSAGLLALQAYLSGGSNTLEPQIASRAGELLRNWLFTGEIWTNFVEKLNDAQNRGEEGLRVRLILEDESLRQLPWEYIYDSKRNYEYLALYRHSPLVRYINSGIIPKRLERDRAARLLLAYSVNPDDQVAVQTAVSELAAIEKELGDLTRDKRVKIENAGQINRDRLQQLLSTFEPDMLHLIAASQAENGPHLIFSNAAGGLVELSASKFKVLLRASARVVILSAPPSQQAENDAGLALAEALLQAEVPAVVALHREMPAAVAGRFAAQFYRYLALGKTLDAAATETRINISLDDEIAWGIPAIYMRAEDGRLWSEAAPVPPPATPATVVVPKTMTEASVQQPSPDQNNDPFSPLLQLNFHSQVKSFDAFLDRRRIGGCLVSNQPQISSELGLKLLMKRLVALVPRSGEPPKKYEFNLDSRVSNNGPTNLWEKLAKKLQMEDLKAPFNRRMQEKIADKLGDQLKRRHVIFVFKNVDKDILNDILSEFWEPLVAIVLDPDLPLILPESRFLFLAFFLDDKGEVLSQTDGKFIEIKAKENSPAQPDGGWKADRIGASYALPGISDFTAADLAPMRSHLEDQDLEAVKTAMENRPEGQRLDFVLTALVDNLKPNENGRFEYWLNQL
ncbi:MAG: CHAT domain-containing protein [Candidatus Promineifilaceae bacterium]